MQVSKYLNPMENQVFQFSVYNFHSMKTSLTKHVLLVWMGYKQPVYGTVPRAYNETLSVFPSNKPKVVRGSQPKRSSKIVESSE